MPKSKTKTDRNPAYNLQAQERRSERQVAINSVSNDPDSPDVQVDMAANGAAPVQPPVIVEVHAPPVVNPPEPGQGVTQPVVNQPVVNQPVINDATPVVRSQFSNSNIVATDQLASSSSAPPPIQVPLINQDNAGPSRAEFLELKEQLAILTATLASINPPNIVAPTPQQTVPTNSLINNGVPAPVLTPNVNMPQHDLLVNNAVNNHIDNILNPTSQSGEVGSFQQADRSITMKVTEAMKQAIWSNQYIDLNRLVDHKMAQPQRVSYEFTGLEGQVPQLTAKAQRGINTIGQWCDAYMIYLTIYCKKYPDQLDPMTSYLARIKLLHSRGGDFLYYDQEFRYMRQSRNLPWDEVHSGLWLECRDRKEANNTNNNRGGGNRGRYSFRGQSNNNSQRIRVPFGHCFAFHNRGECIQSNCPYSHKCFNEGCTGSHPIKKCPKTSGGARGGPKQNNSPSGPPNTNKN